MPWNQVFPLGTSQVSQAPPLFQQNWAFLNTNINTDHFFNTGVPTEGHHQFVQLLDQGAAALAAGMNAVLYTRGTGGSGTIQEPFWTNTNVVTPVQQIPTFITGTTACPAGVQNTTIINMAAGPQPNCMGFIQLFQQGAVNSFACAYYVWNGANVYVTNFVTGPGGLVNAITNSATSRITVNTNFAAPSNVQWAIYLTPI